MGDESDDRAERNCSGKVTVAVIGAGYAGLCAVRHFSADPRYHVTAFEQTDRIGGVWNYPDGCEDHPKAQFDSPFYTTAYRNLLTNLPNDLMSLDGYAFPNDGSFASFSSINKIHRYLEGYVEHFNLGPHIKLRHQVTSVEPCLSEIVHTPGPRWAVTVKNISSGTESTLIYDFILVCIGKYTTPNIPEIPGLSNFTGTILHSREYRNPERYANQTVLVIGGGSSGKDIAIDLSFHANKVILLNRGKSILESRFAKVNEVKSVRKYGAKSILLEDGSEETCDTIILATGYVYHYPFLADSCHVNARHGRVAPLYRHLIHCEYPSMAFPFLIGTVQPVLDNQIMFCKVVADGRLTLPTTQEMLDAKEVGHQERLLKGPVGDQRQLFLGHDLLLPYVEQLSQMAGLEPYEPVTAKMLTAWREFLQDRDEKFTYRSFKLERVDADNCLLVKSSTV